MKSRPEQIAASGNETGQKDLFEAIWDETLAWLGEEDLAYWDNIMVHQDRADLVHAYLDRTLEYQDAIGALNISHAVSDLESAHARAMAAPLKDAIDREVKLIAHAELQCGICGGTWQQEIDLDAIEAHDKEVDIKREIHAGIDRFIGEGWTYRAKDKALCCPGCSTGE